MSSRRNPNDYSAEQQDAAALAALELGAADPREAPPRLVAAMREAAALLADTVAPVAPAIGVRARGAASASRYHW